MFSFVPEFDITMGMATTQLTLTSLFAFEDFAKKLARALPAQGVILFTGDLGAGKSTLIRAVIRARADDEMLEVPSPTFTLVQHYDTQQGPMTHFDLYRLKSPYEIFDLGWEDAINESLVFVEWPERLGAYIPKNAKHIKIIGPINADGHRILETDIV